MNAKELKKLRKQMRGMADRSWREYVDAICKLPLRNKLMWCLFILRHKKAV